MNTETKQYRLTSKIADESFDLQKRNHYNLYLTAGKYNFRAGVLDNERNKFILLADFELNNVFTPIQGAQMVQEIIKESDYLNSADWQQIAISVKNQSFTLVPETLFATDAAEEYLQLNCNLDTYHEQVFTYKHAGIEAINIFAADKYLVNVMNACFPGKIITYLHQTSALIAGLLHYGERNGKRKLYVQVEKNTLIILVVQNTTLEFCNVFHYTTPEDFMYFLIFVMQEHKLNTETDAVTVWGDITHDSTLFSLMRKYIRYIHFGTKPNGVTYSYKLEDIFDHRYLDVYSIHFCE